MYNALKIMPDEDTSVDSEIVSLICELHRKIIRWGNKMYSVSEADYNRDPEEDMEMFYVCEECFRVEMSGVDSGEMSLNSGFELAEHLLDSKWPCSTAIIFQA